MMNLLNSDLTDKEKELGFRQVWIENGRNRFGDCPLTGPQVLRAVAYSVAPTIWLFKINAPLPVNPEPEWQPIIYWEMQYSLYIDRQNEKPSWHNVRAVHLSDPQAAVTAARETPCDKVFISMLPPIIDVVNREVLFSADQVSETEIAQHGGKLVGLDGLEWVAFPIKGSV